MALDGRPADPQDVGARFVDALGELVVHAVRRGGERHGGLAVGRREGVAVGLGDPVADVLHGGHGLMMHRQIAGTSEGRLNMRVAVISPWTARRRTAGVGRPGRRCSSTQMYFSPARRSASLRSRMTSGNSASARGVEEAGGVDELDAQRVGHRALQLQQVSGVGAADRVVEEERARRAGVRDWPRSLAPQRGHGAVQRDRRGQQLAAGEDVRHLADAHPFGAQHRVGLEDLDADALGRIAALTPRSSRDMPSRRRSLFLRTAALWPRRSPRRGVR